MPVQLGTHQMPYKADAARKPPIQGWEEAHNLRATISGRRYRECRFLGL